MSKKSILWTLALVLVLGAATAVWQNQIRHQRKGAAAAEAKAQAKARKLKNAEPDDDTSDKPAPPPKKEPKVTVLSPATKEHLAEQSFIAALREVLIWRGTQPQTPETSRQLLDKLSVIPCDDLPSAQKGAWQSLLQAWKASASPNPQATATLNAMLKAHGDGDIVL